MSDSVTYNPDVLSCLANLSSDEVFTPPHLANKVLDMLPESLWSSPDTTILDPVCKSGVFLREAAKRLDKGLAERIPDTQARINHILTKQLFGIAITDLTALTSRRSLYCSKHANGRYSVCTEFEDEFGNIKFDVTPHTWKDGKCEFCGSPLTQLDRGDDLETHAYQFIHTHNPEEIFNMKFDVIVGNPPYQLSDGGGTGKSARPIYHLFVQQALKLEPRFLTMIIPARWYSGGKGLDQFRFSMINDRRIRRLVDFENATDVFPGVDIAGGVCYFLWDRDNKGACSTTQFINGEAVTVERQLNDYETFVRQSRAIPILEKVLGLKENNDQRLSDLVSPRRPFGLDSTYAPSKDGVPCWFTQKQGLQFANQADIREFQPGILDKWKLLIPFAPIAGQTDFSKPVKFYHDRNVILAEPGQACTESWLVAFSSVSREEVENFKSYLLTKMVRFLLLQAVSSQNITRGYFKFVPNLRAYDRNYTDEFLYDRWGIFADERDYIESRII